MCKILSEIKLKNFKIFYSHEGLDEISLFSPTTFLIKDKSKIKKQTISQNYYKKYLNKVPKFSQIKGKIPDIMHPEYLNYLKVRKILLEIWF